MYETMMKFANEIGITVKEYPFEVVDGLLKGQQIGIRSTLPEEDKPRILAHEIAHAFLHPHRDLIKNPDRQAEADADAAGDMLMQLIEYMRRPAHEAL